MAVTKIWPVRGRVESPLDYAANEEKTANPRWDKSSLQNLTDVMHYAADEDKTEKQFFVSGVNCTPAIARDQFVIVKKQFDKEDGIVAYHGYQSFAEGEVTPELAHEIGLEFAKRVWGEDYQVVVATHLNTKCFHNHFIVNSVSFRHGKRLRAKQWYELKKVSDEICREHGLSVIENRRGKGIPKQLYYAEKNGGSTRVNIAKAAVDEALAVSTNVTEFEMALKAKGYLCNFNPNHKHWTIWQKDWKRPIRLTRMGEEYMARRIMERLDEGFENKTFEVFQKAVVVRRKQYVLFTREDKIKRVGGLKGLYLHYCYLLGYLPKYKQQPTKVSPLLRDDLIKMEQIAKETRLLCRENISSAGELSIFKEKTESSIAAKMQKQRELRNLIKRKITPKEREKARSELTGINDDLKKLRSDLKLAGRIEERSKVIEEKVKTVDKDRSEVKENERRR